MDPGPLSGGGSHPGNGNDNDDSKGEKEIQDGEKGTGKGKGSTDGKGKGKGKGMGKGKATEEGKGKGKGNGKGKRIVEQIPGGDDIWHAVALHLLKEMHEADLATEGLLKCIYFEPEALPSVSISSNDDTDATWE